MKVEGKRVSGGDMEEMARRSVQGLVEQLALVADPRGRQGVLHRFTDILAILVLGTICGCDDAEDLEEWAHKEAGWLGTFLSLPNGIPSQDTYLRALALMVPEQFRTVFRGWAERIAPMLGLNGQVAIDGKTVRGARKVHESKSPVHMVNALACEAGFVIGQIRTEEKSNEITAMPQLLAALSIRGALVSADAMGCQVDIAQTILDQGGDYLLGLKNNQPTLHTEVAALFDEVDDPRARPVDEAPRPDTTQDEQVDAGHGRIETRRATVCHDPADWVPSAARFPQLNRLIRIHATVVEKATGTRTHDTRYYISSRRLTAAEANRAVRTHWAVENRLHWCLDVTFSEDACRVRTHHAAENLAVVRQFALNIVRAFQGDRRSLRRRRKRCDYNFDYRSRVLAASVI